MNRWTHYCLFVVLFALLPSRREIVGQEPEIDKSVGQITHVTLYRNQALVSREIPVPAGQQQRVVRDIWLPLQVVEGSVHAECDQGEVRAVRMEQVRSALRPDEPAMKKVTDQLAVVQQQQLAVKSQLETVDTAAATLKQLVTFSGSATGGDLGRGVLQAESLTKIADYTFAKQKEVASRQFELKTQLEELTKQHQALQKELTRIQNADAKPGNRVTVFLDTKQADAAATLRLKYLVAACGWDPQYNVRGDSAEQTVELEFNAVVHQNGGEDWEDVELVFSTASPWIRASRPQLTPFRITSETTATTSNDPFSDAEQAPAPKGQREVAASLRSIRAQRSAANSGFGNASGGMGMGMQMAANLQGDQQRDVVLNRLAAQVQHLELESDATVWRRVAEDASEGLGSQSYQLDRRVTLSSQREQQMVRVHRIQTKADFYHVATPLLSSFAYREAEIPSTEGVLGGPATTYLDGRFVGSTLLPTTAAGQRLVLGFGADQQVRTRRELVQKEEEIKGGNRQLQFTYKLVLANFKESPVALRLMDRMPLTRQQQQLSIRLEDPETPLSKDGLYNRVSRPLGVLRWDVELNAKRHGSEAFDVVYSYTVEFDRSRRLAASNLDDIAGDIGAQATQGMGGMGGMGGFGGGFGGAAP